jgi:phosphoglycerate dehydrogenase-like enzyme
VRGARPAAQTVAVAPGGNATPGLEERLREAGYRVVEIPPSGPGGRPGPGELRDRFGEADAIVAMPRGRYSREVLEAAPRLRLITSGVIGVDHIDVEAASDLGVLVANCPTRENVVGVAEATVMLAVALLLRLEQKQEALRSGRWRTAGVGTLLWRKTVGLVGYGRIGRAVHERLGGWGVEVRYHDPAVEGSTDLDALLRTSDVVSLHVVLTSRTRGLLGARELGLMRSSAVLVNTSRGGTVDEAALAAAIDGGRLAGAALDVFQREPLEPESPLLRCDPHLVILTPHSIGHSLEVGPSGARLAFETVERALRGDLPESVVNPEVEPAWRGRLARLDAAAGGR